MLPLMCKVVRVHIKKVFLKGAYAWGKYVSENSQKLKVFLEDCEN